MNKIRLEIAARALLDDVKRRYPGEELRCLFMRELGAAVEELEQNRAYWLRQDNPCGGVTIPVNWDVT
jgi:hypothetical protein